MQETIIEKSRMGETPVYFGITTNKKLYDKNGIRIYDSKMGKLLYLDNALQSVFGETIIGDLERIFYSRTSAINNLSAFNKNELDILVIGGGDGQSVRDLLSISDKMGIKLNIDWCEISSTIIDACEQHIPESKIKENKKRVNLFIMDGFYFLDKNNKKYDVIISDISDPIGQAARLYTLPYFKKCFNKLKENALFFTQAGSSIYGNISLIKKIDFLLRKCFDRVYCELVDYPPYPGGHINILNCVKGNLNVFNLPQEQFNFCDLNDRKFLLNKFSKEDFIISNIDFYNPVINNYGESTETYSFNFPLFCFFEKINEWRYCSIYDDIFKQISVPFISKQLNSKLFGIGWIHKEKLPNKYYFLIKSHDLYFIPELNYVIDSDFFNLSKIYCVAILDIKTQQITLRQYDQSGFDNLAKNQSKYSRGSEEEFNNLHSSFARLLFY